MGNINGVPAAGGQGAPQAMNIPPDGQMMNDPNNPHYKQMMGCVLNGMIPIVGICLFAYTAKKHIDDTAYTAKKHGDETFLLKQEHDDNIVKLVKKHDYEKTVLKKESELTVAQQDEKHRDERKNLTQKSNETFVQLAERQSAAISQLISVREGEKNGSKRELDYTVAQLDQQKDVMLDLERKEDILLQTKLKELKVYDEMLKEILVVRCSWITWKEKRLKLEETLLSGLKRGGNPLQGLDMRKDLHDIFNHVNNDYRFSSNYEEENGKLRQMYMEHWKLKVKLHKYKSIVEGIKEWSWNKK